MDKLIYEQMIREILSEEIKLSKSGREIENHENLKDLGMDSMNFIRFAISLETRLDVMFKPEDLLERNFESIQKTLKTLEKI